MAKIDGVFAKALSAFCEDPGSPPLPLYPPTRPLPILSAASAFFETLTCSNVGWISQGHGLDSLSAALQSLSRIRDSSGDVGARSERRRDQVPLGGKKGLSRLAITAHRRGAVQHVVFDKELPLFVFAQQRELEAAVGKIASAAPHLLYKLLLQVNAFPLSIAIAFGVESPLR